MHFERSERSTLGVEWELALVDRETGELAPAADEVIARVDDPRVKGEFFTNTIELVTGVHRTSAEAMLELRELRDRVLEAADAAGVDVIGAGTHPFSRWRDQELTDTPRYRRLIEHVGSWAEQQVIFGVHNHIGVDDAKRFAVPSMRVLVERLPLLLALSASSPFWEGADSGCASQRAMLFQQLPTAGMPPDMHTWDDWCRVAHDLVHVGAVQTVSELRWDVRLSPTLGTVESRIPDGSTSLLELHAVTALTHCLVEEGMRMVEAGIDPAPLPRWLTKENKWRATRWGLDAVVILDTDGGTASIRETILSAVERLAPLAEELGATSGLRAVERVVARGESAALQRRAAATAGMRGVVSHLVDELRRDD